MHSPLGTRHSAMLLGLLRKNLSDGADEGAPGLLFGGELFAAGLGEAVVLGRPVGFGGGTPLCFYPALFFEPVERGIERALRDLKDVTGDLLDPMSDRPAVH